MTPNPLGNKDLKYSENQGYTKGMDFSLGICICPCMSKAWAMRGDRMLCLQLQQSGSFFPNYKRVQAYIFELVPIEVMRLWSTHYIPSLCEILAHWIIQTISGNYRT